MKLHRTLLLAALAASLLGTATQAQNLDVELVTGGLSAPLFVDAAPGDSDRLYVLEQNTRRVRVIENGSLLAMPFLDLSGVASSGGERGLLGIAFHPDWVANGRFFVSYTNTSGNSRVMEYARTTPNVANPTAVQTILTQNQPFSNHNGGCIRFGPDGKLYIGLGDGGSGNDPGNRAQTPTTNLGKILRLDIDLPSPFIPADNPFVGDPSTNDEIWALGVRNPWRFNFDMANGDLYMGDVGQNQIEEINWVPGTSTGGENYGWRCMEGNSCTGLSGCTCMAASLTDPVQTYNHGLGCSVTGGYVYRSPEIPGLSGTYFYGDFCSSRIWSFRIVGGAVTEFTDRTTELSGPVGNISSFGQDNEGNVYIVDSSDGQIFKIVGDCGSTLRYCQSTPNSNSAGAVMSSAGPAEIGTNNFSVVAAAAATGSFGLFFYGPNQIMAPFGDGFRCVGGTTSRLNPPVMTDGFGDVTRQVDFNAPPANAGAGQITPGSTWNFQFWFRDPMGPGATGFNLTDGLSVIFCP